MRARRIGGLDPAAPLRPNAARVVRIRLEELLSLAEAALAPEAVTAQHDARIAAKRLRYVLEIAGRCFGPEARAARDAARDLQGLLGEIHDCDVMAPRAGRIESLNDFLCARRELLFDRFAELWAQQRRAGVWTALERSL
jgi:CHAD domain-containing protein